MEVVLADSLRKRGLRRLTAGTDAARSSIHLAGTGHAPTRNVSTPSRSLGHRHPARRAQDPVRGTPNPGTASNAAQFVRHPRARRYVIRVRERRLGAGDDSARRIAAGSARISRGGSGTGSTSSAQRVAQEQRAVPRTGRHRRSSASGARGRRASCRRVFSSSRLTHGLRVNRISVRNQRWRWGSCSRIGHICLNWRLAQMPPSIRDYVMIHELMHLKQMDHSPKFWKLVAAACPDYQAARHGCAKTDAPTGKPQVLPKRCLRPGSRPHLERLQLEMAVVSHPPMPTVPWYFRRPVRSLTVIGGVTIPPMRSSTARPSRSSAPSPIWTGRADTMRTSTAAR